MCRITRLRGQRSQRLREFSGAGLWIAAEAQQNFAYAGDHCLDQESRRHRSELLWKRRIT